MVSDCPRCVVTKPRAYITSKGDAFAAPYGLTENWLYSRGGERSNDMNKYELVLIAAYEELGRPDLADCVRRGKFYQRLNDCLYQHPDFSSLDSLRHSAIGTRYPQRTLEEWEEAMFKKFEGHEGLRRVREGSAAVMSLERDQDVP